MKLGDKIKSKRKERGLSQEELANKCGLNRNSIYKYEKNETIPKLDQIKKIAKALDVPVNDLTDLNTFDAKYNKDGQLAEEVKIFETISKTFGENASALVNDFNRLNEVGQAKASEYVADLTEQKKYLKTQK